MITHQMIAHKMITTIHQTYQILHLQAHHEEEGEGEEEDKEM